LSSNFVVNGNRSSKSVHLLYSCFCWEQPTF
jgi:hypothetical protein